MSGADNHPLPPSPAGRSLEEVTPETMLEQIGGLQSDLAAVRCVADEASHLCMLGLLSATTAHEIRNLLTPALSYAQLAKSRRSDGALVEKALERIITALKGAAAIVDGTLEHARIDEARSHETAAIDDAVREVINMLPRHPAHDQIHLVMDIEPGLRVAIAPLSLRQVLLNLFLNAIEAMKSIPLAQHERRLMVKTRRAAPPLAVLIEVSDTGPGVPQEAASRLFDPFGGAGRAHERARQGAASTGESGGLGLSICRRLISAVGGVIEHEKATSDGAMFRIRLSAAATALRKAG